MRGIRWMALAAIMALALGGTALVAGAQGGGKEAPQATEVGVSATEFHVAVIADVDNAAQPGLFQGAVNGVKGWAKYMNAHGGLAKRKVVVDFVDSHLSNTDARNGVISACQSDFAMVGTAALFLNNVDDLKTCADKSGAATGLPDIPVVATEFAQQCNTTSFPINPPQLRCNTVDQHPQTYLVQAGRANFYKKKYGKDIHGLFLYTSDLASARNANTVTATGLFRLGIKADTAQAVSALAPQSALTPFVQQLKNKQGNFAEAGLAYVSTVGLRKEAKLQGIDPTKVIWSCTVQCYDRRLLEQGGADVEGQYTSLTFLPFEEAKANKSVANFLKFTGRSNADGFAAQAWEGGLLLRDAVNAVVKKGGVNAVTRKAVLDELNNIHSFNADGMGATTDIAGRNTSPCYLLMQVKNGKWVRAFPSKAGTFDCSKKNLVTFKYDAGE